MQRRLSLVIISTTALLGSCGDNEAGSVACGQGTTLSNGTCVPSGTAATCGAGTVLLNGECVPDGSAPTCGEGTALLNGECVLADTACGEGTTLQNGECVPDGSAPTCGEGTTLVGTECVPDTNHGTCGSGTVMQDGECLPAAALGGFEVSVTPVGCDLIVQGVVPARVTVRALDTQGAVLLSYAGTALLEGIGITVSPERVTGFIDGEATLDLTVSGNASEAQIVVFDEILLTRAGVSPTFVVEAERPISVEAQAAAAVRYGADLPVTVTVTTNACRTAAFTDEPVTISAPAAGPATVAGGAQMLTGEGPFTVTIQLMHNEATRQTVPLTVKVGDLTTSLEVAVVPLITFAGVRTAVGRPSAIALEWLPASGGEGDITFSVYNTATFTTVEDLFAGAASESGILELSALIDELANNVTQHVAVRAVDELGPDTNTVVLTVTPGAILFVDAADEVQDDDGEGGFAADAGSAANPVDTIGEALELVDITSAVAIRVASGTYDLEGAPAAIPAGLHLLGGLARTPDSTDINGWSFSGAPSVVTSTSAMSEIPVTLGSTSVFAHFDLQTAPIPTVDGVSTIHVYQASGATLRDLLIGAQPTSDAAAVFAEDSLALTIADTSIDGGGVGSGGDCVMAVDSELLMDNIYLTGCARGFSASGSNVTFIGDSLLEDTDAGCAFMQDGGSLSVQGTTFRSCNGGGLIGSGLTRMWVSGATFNGATMCVSGNGTPDFSVTDSLLDNCSIGAIQAGSDNLVAVVERNSISQEGGTGGGYGIQIGGEFDVFDIRVADNTVSDIQSAIAVGVAPQTGVGTVRLTGNMVRSAGIGLLVQSQGLLSFLDVTIDGNVVTGAMAGIYISAYNTGGGGPVPAMSGEGILRVEGNTLASCQSPLNLVAVYFLEASIAVIDNDVFGGASGGGGGSGSVWAANAYVQNAVTEMRGNRLVNTHGLSFWDVLSTQSETEISNNIVAGAGLPTGGIVLVANQTQNMDSRIEHNTIEGYEMAIALAPMSEGDASAGSIRVANNLLQHAGDPGMDNMLGERVSVEVAYNMLDPDATEFDTNFPAEADFVSVPTRIELASAYDPDTGCFSVTDATLYTAGDALLLDLDETSRAVTSTDTDTNTVCADGIRLPYASSALSVMHWIAPDSFAAVDLHLAAESAGIDAGDPESALDLDGSLPDVGAYGGPGAASLP